MSKSEEKEEQETLYTCWCGAEGTYDELFSDEGLEDGCGGLGVIHCYCGGDLCACHNHGETDCPGCDDCRERDDPFWQDHEDYE
jgi:hypothetical protein